MAIFSMIAANMAAYSLRDPHPFWFRLYGSFAAPAFILLSGMMVAYTSLLKRSPFKHYLRQGLGLLAVAALLDVLCWQIEPFATFDVLYLIGLSIPCGRLFLALGPRTQLAVISALLVLTPLLREYIGYARPDPDTAPSALLRWPALHQLLIGGWFPLFPWLGVFLIGCRAGSLRAQRGIPAARTFLPLGAVLFGSGVVSWVLLRPSLRPRSGYTELFYPPTLPYLCSALGAIFLLLAALPRLRPNWALRVFSAYGRKSLLLYVVHTALIAFVFKVFWPDAAWPLFLLLYVTHTATLGLIIYVLGRMKQRGPGGTQRGGPTSADALHAAAQRAQSTSAS